MDFHCFGHIDGLNADYDAGAEFFCEISPDPGVSFSTDNRFSSLAPEIHNEPEFWK